MLISSIVTIFHCWHGKGEWRGDSHYLIHDNQGQAIGISFSFRRVRVNTRRRGAFIPRSSSTKLWLSASEWIRATELHISRAGWC